MRGLMFGFLLAAGSLGAADINEGVTQTPRNLIRDNIGKVAAQMWANDNSVSVSPTTKRALQCDSSGYLKVNTASMTFPSNIGVAASVTGSVGVSSLPANMGVAASVTGTVGVNTIPVEVHSKNYSFSALSETATSVKVATATGVAFPMMAYISTRGPAAAIYWDLTGTADVLGVTALGHYQAASTTAVLIGPLDDELWINAAAVGAATATINITFTRPGQQ